MQNMMSSYLKIKKLVEDEESDFVEGEEDEEEDLEEERAAEVKFMESQLKKKKLSLGEGSGKSATGKTAAGGGAAVAPPCCLVENCEADLRNCKKYHQRHRVCEVHAKAPVALVDGLRQRFCQQCSRFHELSEFDQTKRSCRRRLAGHNERRRKDNEWRRKSSIEPQKEESSRRLKENHCRQLNERTKIGSSKSQNFHIHSTH